MFKIYNLTLYVFFYKCVRLHFSHIKKLTQSEQNMFYNKALRTMVKPTKTRVAGHSVRIIAKRSLSAFC